MWDSHSAARAIWQHPMKVTGSVLLPVSGQSLSQEEIFTEIAKAEEAQGFVRSDRALGTDIYIGDSLQLHIRGTSEGVSMSATSACSGLPWLPDVQPRRGFRCVEE